MSTSACQQRVTKNAEAWQHTRFIRFCQTLSAFPQSFSSARMTSPNFNFLKINQSCRSPIEPNIAFNFPFHCSHASPSNDFYQRRKNPDARHGTVETKARSHVSCSHDVISLCFIFGFHSEWLQWGSSLQWRGRLLKLPGIPSVDTRTQCEALALSCISKNNHTGRRPINHDPYCCCKIESEPGRTGKHGPASI